MPTSIRLLLTASCLLAFWSARKASAEQTWIEIRSPHFRVLTDSSASDGRKVANEFEQMRHVFVLRFNNEQIGGGAPLTIFAARNDETFRQLQPEVWKESNGRYGGDFLRGWEKQFAIIRLDLTGDSQIAVFHEYTHSILHANTRWLPTWLDEGVAEFYGYTSFEPDRILIGAKSLRMGWLTVRPLIPVSTMLKIDVSALNHDVVDGQMFYAESWAMVHYIIFGPGMGNGDKLGQFLKLLEQGVPQEKAFIQIFGDPNAFQISLTNYCTHFTFQASVMPADAHINPKSFPERKLTPAETILGLCARRQA